MILIPELETVVVLVPRTGSGSLRKTIAATYPRSMLIYRHMEADGVPHGYDRWQKVGVVRNPLDRLWSLYKFLKQFSGSQHDPAYVSAMRSSVDMPFSTWLVNNQTVFTSPYDAAGLGRFFPVHTVRHPIPETRKSQFMYLRPDLGTVIYRFDRMKELADRLKIDMDLHHENRSFGVPLPDLTGAAIEHIWRWFSWDFAAAGAVLEQAA